METTDWAVEAKNILKAALKRRGLTYKGLAALFVAAGTHETEPNIRNKLARGTFTAAFFLQVLALTGTVSLPVGRYPADSTRPARI
jgi:hypothetical protein